MTTEELTENDERALTLRGQSLGFGNIAETLGLAKASEANEAFNRALRRRLPEEQATIRAEENGRLDRLAESVRTDATRDPKDIERRLRAVERLRTRLMAD